MLEIATWKRKNLKRNSQPCITINPKQIKFNHAFVKLLEREHLDWSSHVSCLIDNKTHHLGFMFHTESDMDCALKITRQNNTFAISAYSLVKNYAWISDVANTFDIKKRKFKPEKRDSVWVIALDGPNVT